MLSASGMKIVFTCLACRKPVAPGKGWICVDMAKVNQVEVAVAEWRRANPGPAIDGAALFDYPATVPWQVHHEACDPDKDHSCYWFDVGRCDTWPRLAHWTAHLMGKSWLEHTNWRDLLEGLGEDA